MTNKEFNDLGLGTKARRLINHDGSFNVTRVGQPISFINVYQWLIRMKWLPFLLLTLSIVIIINSLFATLYFFIGINHFTGIEAATSWEQYLKCMFFSFQTFTTVGYGYISPQGHVASSIAAFEALTGLMIFAIITGLLYGRFAKPAAKFLFSENILFSPFQEGRSLQFRIINQRKSMVMDMRVRMLVSFREKNGARTYKALELERDNVVLFPLNWTIVHPITNASPIHGKTLEELQQLDAEFIIVLKGYDDTFSQEIHSIHSYTYHDIVWNAKFNLMYESSEDGSTLLHVNRLNDYTRL